MSRFNVLGGQRVVLVWGFVTRAIETITSATWEKQAARCPRRSVVIGPKPGSEFRLSAF